MTDWLFQIKDADGDEFSAYPASNLTRPMTGDGSAPAVIVRIQDRLTGENAAYLSAAEVDRIIAALASYGTQPRPVAPHIEAGKEYRLLDGAQYRAGGTSWTSSLANDGTTRIEVTDGPDSDGDYTVTALDGDSAKSGGYSISPEYIAALEPATSYAQLADEAVRSLDQRRIAAATAASQLLGTGLFGGGNATAIASLAAFLLGEEAA